MEIVADKTHARLGPSGWEWWSNCPGAPALCDGLPNKTSFYAAEGSVAHEIADRVLSGEAQDASFFLDATFTHEGFDITVDQEMVDSVNFYVDTVLNMKGEGILLPEQSLPIGHLTGEEGAHGTADAIIINDKRMTVIDLKYGKGVRVSAEGNGQGRMYALGALHKFGMVYDHIEEVEIMIIQPRVEDGVTSEVLSIGELEEFRDLVELAAARVALNTGPVIPTVDELELVPGEKQCKFCSAKGICPALQAEVSNSMALVSTATAEDFADLTVPKQAASIAVRPDVSNEKLAEFLRAVPMIEQAIAGVRGEVERRLFEGQTIPGFYLGEGKKGNRQWSDEEAARKAIVKRGRLTKDQAFEQKLISPAKAAKLLNKDTMELLSKEGLIVQADGKPSVCKEGDKNPPYEPVKAGDFADLSAESEAQRLLG